MANQSPHVLIFPIPFQGPLNSMLKLAELLCLHNIRVTFLNTQHIQHRLFNCSNSEVYWKKYPNFCFKTVPDGLPEDNPRTAYQFSEVMRSVEAVVEPILGEMVTCGAYSCIIADGILTFAADIAAKIGLPLLVFETISPCGLWSYMCCLPKLIEDGELPFKDDNLDEVVTNAPGTKAVIRRRDLPSFCRTIDFDDTQVRLVLDEMKNVPSSQGLILNTFQDLDAPILSQMRKICPNIYPVGPLHSHLKARLIAEDQYSTINSNSIWKEDGSCISWLDQQLPKSVIYVSIGSLSVMTKDQFFEIWHGLVSSGSSFLWVQRAGSVNGLDPNSDEDIPIHELLLATKERGCIVSWAPQEEVLAHPAIGGFLTHSGWNSTLESIVEGKPMICWPHYVDQLVNSRFVGEVWKIGLDMKDTCDRATVEMMIREIMELRKDEFLERAEEMSKLAKSSVCKGGSSIMNFNRLVEDIKMLMKKPTE